ncbi:MAG: single-stranded-DNA-specific exonuclease RecJ [Rhodospirillales bacterium]
MSLSDAALFGVERSLTGRRWLASAADEEVVGRLVAQHALPELICRLLAERGIDHARVPDYLTPTLRTLLPDPSSLIDMDRAAERLCAAIVAGESITVFADYDVDGATSAALLRRFLAAVGCQAGLYVPDRAREGYGPSAQAFLKLREEGATLVVTVDCGTSAHQAIAAAAAVGLDVIVIDHHQAPEMPPPAVAVVNPNRADDRSGSGNLAAVGVTFLLVVALNRVLRRHGWYGERPEPDLRRWLDLVALGTVCDMVPLAGVNRAFVVQGLKVAAAGNNPGLAAIRSVAGLRGPPIVHDLGFAIGPRINAGGRVGESDLGARLLSSDDPGEVASLAGRLDALNRQRQRIEAGVLERALQEVPAAAAAAPLIWVAGEQWHPGVIGIVASRLVERFHKPAVVLAVADDEAVASCRSVIGIDLGRAIREALAEGLLRKGGGHVMAGGFTVARERLMDAGRFLAGAVAGQIADGAGVAPTLRITASLGLAGLGSGWMAGLDRLAPFGTGNPEPLFVVEAARLQWTAKTTGPHLSCSLVDQRGGRMSAMLFRAAGSPLGKALTTLDGATVHVAGRVRRRRDGAPFFAIEDAAMPV